MNDTDLMRRIWHDWDGAISGVTKLSSVPAAFLAALIANESGGNKDAFRFEKNTLIALWDVLLARRASYEQIGRDNLIGYLGRTPQLAAAALRLDSLATSWGLTQIMGWQILAPISGIVPNAGTDVLRDPEQNIRFAVRLLVRFANQYMLDLTQDFGDLFRCWNTGRPDGQTFDPNYAANGLARMQIYSNLATAPTPAP